MNDFKTLGIENMVRSDAPDEYKQHALQWARQKVSNQLFDFLWQYKLPAVVDIDEQIDEKYQNEYMAIPNDRIRIKVTVTPVQYKNIVMPYMFSDVFRIEEDKNILKKLFRKLRIIKW